MKDFRKLKVWEKAHAFVLTVYTVTRNFPKEEIYGLTSQIKRASLSIGLNIVEGCGRNSNADFKRFLQIAFGSACEAEYCIILSHDLKYITYDEFIFLQQKIIEVKMMLSSLMNKLTTDKRSSHQRSLVSNAEY